MEALTLAQISKVNDACVFVNDPDLRCSPLSFQKPWNPPRKPDQFTLRCTCRNTKCLKKYCVCFQRGVACGADCYCSDCQNTKPREMSDDEKMSQRKCTCKRTRCLKLYCVCFAAGSACGSRCSCKDCANDRPLQAGLQTPNRGTRRVASKKRKRAAPLRMDAFLDDIFDDDVDGLMD